MQSGFFMLGVTLLLCGMASAESVKFTIDATRAQHRISRLLTGTCIEDVNHEIYGGLYSQMIFGESFQEPPPASAPKGFRVLEATWQVDGDKLMGPAGTGPKMLSELPPFTDGETGVDVFFSESSIGNAGLIVRVSNARAGSDNFDGYEISLDTAAQMLRLGRHRHNWELLADTPCEVPVGRWIQLKASMKGALLEVFIDGKRIVRHEDNAGALGPGTVGLRQWMRGASYRNFWAAPEGKRVELPFVAQEAVTAEVSGMWRSVSRGSATGACRLEKEGAFTGAQSQRIEFNGGEGAWGIENRGLNRWGLSLKESSPYEGIIWAKAAAPTEIWLTLENADGSVTYAERKLDIATGDWQRLTFDLTPSGTETRGRFSVSLREPGSVCIGYVFLQPGEWGRFKGLPVRRDVAELMVDEGLTILRYGGSMVNHAQYRWKNMVGPRDRRPPYQGTWYPYSTNGWGIIDFMDFCEAAGFEYIPAFNAKETPQDMADFIEYAKGPADSPWGRKRVENGHPEPYKLRYIQVGNEEHVDTGYAARFEAIAKVVWPLDPDVILVVGDFVYGKPIQDPFHFSGHASGLTTLEGQQQILQLVRENNREVWFDLHVGTDGPRPDSTLEGTLSFVNALESLAQGARFRVVVFEFNAGNHQHRRGLANALAVNAIERDGRIPVTCSANGLQPDGQNDNDWDQGLLFLNPSQVWLQSPGWVMRMVSRHYQPVALQTEGPNDSPIDISAKQSEDGKTLVLQAVNLDAKPVDVRLSLKGFHRSSGQARVEALSAPLDAVNTATQPLNVRPQSSEWSYQVENGEILYTFMPHSFTLIEFGD